ncbi:MAG: hypothetical protein ACFE0Q_03495 [Anaerolineae bacterium]
MFSFIIMMAFSLYLAGYGYIALFKQEWLMNVRAFSAKVEGKGELKHEDLTETVGQARRIMAVISLMLGVIGLVLSVMMIVLYIQAQNGPIAV